MNWKDIKIDNVDYIEKCVAEFEITALDFFEDLYEDDIIHYGSFKVKVYEQQSLQSFSHESPGFTGFTNLRLKDSYGQDGYEGGMGFGRTLEEALENTIRNFMDNLKERKNQRKAGLYKEDLVLLAYDEF